MPDTWCQGVFTHEDDALLSESEAMASNPKSFLDGDLAKGADRIIEESVEKRCINLLEDRSRGHQDDGSRREDEERRLLDNVRHDQWPTRLESKAMYSAGKALRMDPIEIINLPAMKVVSGDTNYDSIPIITDTIKQLHDSKMPRGMWAEYAVNKIAFLDIRAQPSLARSDSAGYVRKPIPLDELRVVHVISDENGKFPRGKESFPRGKELLWLLSHEISHVHETEPSGVFKIIDFYRFEEWKHAVTEQLKSGPVSWYPMLDLLAEGKIGGMKTQESEEIEDLARNVEFVSEHFAAWVTDSKRDFNKIGQSWAAAPLCDEMNRFFDKYVPETFK